MRFFHFLIAVLLFSFAFSQNNKQISTIDFVQVTQGLEEEALFYFQNNWEVLRKMAVEKGYISSYQFLKTKESPEAAFSLMLITTYKDHEQFEKREENFGALIEEKGPLKLLNDHEPNAFRTTLFSKEEVVHLEEI